MILFEEVIPDLVLLFKETNLIHDVFGKIVVFEDFIPINELKRIYIISEVKTFTTRGHHSHNELHQLLISLNGSVSIVVDNGFIKKTVLLDSNSRALYIGPNVWHTMTWNDSQASLVVLASEIYNENDYVRDYGVFLKMVKK